MTRFVPALVLLGACATAAARPEEPVPLKSLPAKVVAAVKGVFPNAKFESAVKEVEDGEAHYTVTLKAGGKEYDVTVHEDGTVTEISREIAFKDLPRPVAAAVLKAYPKAKVDGVHELTDPDTKAKTYYLDLTTAKGKEVAVEYDPAGKLLSEE
jgi:outer membrane receptor protein involved in Fe transport